MKFIKITFLVMALTITLLVSVEGILRLFNGIPNQIARPVFYSNLMGDFDPNLSTTETLSKQLTYSIKTNTQGLRSNKEFSIVKPENTLRVLCIGDSFTYGTGVDNEFTYPELLQKLLSAKFPEKNIEVINAGVFLYDIIDEFDYYEEKGNKLNADFVVLQYYVNDLEGMTRWFFRPHNKTGAKLSPFVSFLKQTATFNLAALAHFKLFGDRIYSQQNDSNSNKKYDKFLVQGSPEQVETIFNQDKLLDESNYNSIESYWNNYLFALSEFKSEVEANKSKFIFIMIPDEKQVNRYKNGYNYALNNRLNEMSIDYIDMLPELRQLTKINHMSYYSSPYDFHLNKYGYTIVAKTIFEQINNSFSPHVKNEAEYSTPKYRTYRNGTETILPNNGLSPDGNKQKLTTSHNNINCETSNILGSKYTLFHKIENNNAPGSLEITTEYEHPIKYFSVVTPSRLGKNKTGALNVYYSCDNGPQTEIAQYINNSEQDDAFERIEFEEINLQTPCRKLKIEYKFYGNATIFFNENTNDDRKLKIIGYP